MVAALLFCDEHAAFGASAPFFVDLFVDDVAISFVFLHHALLAEEFLACGALRWCDFHVDLAFA